MILKTRAGNVELRSEWGTEHLISRPWFSSVSAAGEVVSTDAALGLPAVLAAIRLVSETIGGLPCIVYSGQGSDRKRDESSWQWSLLHDQPNPEQSPFDFFSELASSIEATGNAFVQKAKSRRRVEALFVLNPWMVTVGRKKGTGEKVYRVTVDGKQREFGPDEILHIRGFAPAGSDTGLSPITVCRNALGSALAQDRFHGRYYLNDARPGLVVKFPQGVTKVQADQWKDDWAADHGGAWNAHKPAVLGGGADITTIPISLEDAQFIEGQRFSVEQVARIFQVPSSLLGQVVGGGTPQSSADESERFLKYSLQPRLRRIELALRSDRDLFSHDLYCEFLADAILRSDIQTRYEAYRAARQAGWLSPNEIRNFENMPPVDGGDDIQMTPVGGAPNPGLPAQTDAEAE